MNRHIGSTLQSLFEETDDRAAVELLTIKKLIAARIQASMQSLGYNQTQLAKAMQTNRLQVQRLLDPEHTGLTIDTLARAASVLNLRVDLAPKRRANRARPSVRVAVPKKLGKERLSGAG